MDWKAVRDKNFRSLELANWTEAKYITFLRFMEQFMVPSEDGPKLSYKPELWHKAEEILQMPDHPFQEYLWRINRFSSDGGTVRQFHKKRQDLLKKVLDFIQKNPSVVTDEMRKIIQTYPEQFGWSLKQSEIVPTVMGFPVISSKEHANIASFDQRLYTAGVKVVDVLERLADSITDKDIKAMNPRDKMIAMGRMGYIFQIAKSLKPNKQIFNQININGASREELEASLLKNVREG